MTYEIITSSNMTQSIARLLNKSATKRHLCTYSDKNEVGQRFTFIKLTKQQCIQLIDGNQMPSYTEDGKTLCFDMTRNS